jgi:hypothetical protein
MDLFDDDRDSKRTLGERDKKILYRNADGKCQNCKEKIDYDQMQVSHKTAWSKGGRTTLKNSVCLCWRCNNLQGPDSWATFQKKQGREDKTDKVKKLLKDLTIKQLKSLAEKHHIKVKGRTSYEGFEETRNAPTKKSYINKLASVVSEEEINSLPKEVVAKKKRKKRSS